MMQLTSGSASSKRSGVKDIGECCQFRGSHKVAGTFRVPSAPLSGEGFPPVPSPSGRGLEWAFVICALHFVFVSDFPSSLITNP